MQAFVQHWGQRFSHLYRDLPLAQVSWVTGTADPELCRLVIEGVVPRGTPVVDVGCGAGVESVFLAVQGMRVVGLDASPDALAAARRLAGVFGVRPLWVLGDVLHAPLAAGCAGLVNDSFFFHNVCDEARDAYARSLFRLLAPDGYLRLRAFSDRMTPGTGPRRLSSEEILETFLPGFVCEHLSLSRSFPTEKRPDQLHWSCLWRRKARYGERP